jgi:hypothetical protein
MASMARLKGGSVVRWSDDRSLDDSKKGSGGIKTKGQEKARKSGPSPGRPCYESTHAVLWTNRSRTMGMTMSTMSTMAVMGC